MYFILNLYLKNYQVSSIAGLHLLVSGWVMFGITLLVCAIIVTVLVWIIIKLRSATKKKSTCNFQTMQLCIELLHLNRATSPVNDPSFGVYDVPELEK